MYLGRFTNKSLRARALTMDLVEKHELVSIQNIAMINHSKQLNCNTKTLTPDSTTHKAVVNTSELEDAANTVIVKIEKYDDYMFDKDMEVKKDDNSLKLEETGNCFELKIDKTEDSKSVDKDIEVKKEVDNGQDHIGDAACDISDNTIKFESKLDDAIYEVLRQSSKQGNTEHTIIKNRGGNDECDKNLKYELHTAERVSLIAEKQAIQGLIDDSDQSTHVAQTLVALWAARLEMHNENKVTIKEETKPVSNYVNRDVDKQSDNKHQINHVDSKLLGNCVVKLCDIFKTPVQTKKTAKMTPLAAKLKANINRAVLKTTKSKTASSKSNIDSKKKCLENKSLGNEEYICDICGNTYNFRRGIVRHLRSHRKQKLYTCQFCQFKGIHKMYKTHMRSHAGEKNFTCNFCEYKTSNKTHLNVHMTTHTGIKPFACVLCAYRCSQNSCLLKHMRTHTGEKRYTCTICDFKCIITGDMVRHMRTHTGEKPHTCSVCKRKFSKKCHLLDHMSIHTGIKRYACDMCEFRTAQRSGLVVHKRTHTGEKPYVCRLCNYKFRLNSGLVLHMRTHTGDKPFICHICPQKYSHKPTLMKHLKHHADKND